ncbi:hypothetical protein OB920_06620 [Halobacteria archaeon HArc-gm2]|nr:hypothetical protein [Halobacteria archaeon HArc-gm2]
MRETDNNREKLSRRRYAQLVAGSSAAALAGCPESGSEGTETEPATSESDTDESTTTDGDSTPDPSNRMTDTVRVFVLNTPDTFDWNPHTPQDNTTGDLFMSELHGMSNSHDTSKRLHGDDATFDAPWVQGKDEISLVTWIKDWEVEPPYDLWNTHDERSTFWNGEPNDAETRYKYDKVRYFVEGNKFQEGQIHRAEAESQWRYHFWHARAEVEGADDDPANEPLLADEAAATDGDPPLPQEWSDPKLREFDAAGTQERYNEVISNVRGDRVSLERLAENGWGTGPYELRSTDDIGSDRAILRLRDEDAESPHPHREHINIPKLQLQFGNEDREQTLANNGAIDVHAGSITPNNTWNPESLPDHVDNVTTYLRPNGGDSWWFNWNNPHLGRLWVRRALVTAIDWNVVGANGWGDQRSVPLEHDTGMLDAHSESTFSEEFLNSLHSWPKEADVETANEYMKRAGYTKNGNIWVDPDGNDFKLDVLITSNIEDWIGAGQTIRQQLRNFGVDATFTQQDWGTWSNNLDTFNNEEPNFDTSIHWYNQPTRFGYYKSQAAWWDNASLLGGDPNATGSDRRAVDPDDEFTIKGEVVQAHLPTKVGSIEAPDQAGQQPDLEGVTDYEEVNMAEVVENIRKPADSEEELQERFRTCARYYNYYVPKFAFHQYTYGEWANVRDFDWPGEDDDALDWERSFNITDTVTLGGIAQASYDSEMDR